MTNISLFLPFSQKIRATGRGRYYPVCVRLKSEESGAMYWKMGLVIYTVCIGSAFSHICLTCLHWMRRVI